MMRRYTAIEKTLKKALTALNSRNEKPRNGNWTRFVARKVASAAKRHGYRTRGHGHRNSEFMYDMIWLKKDHDGRLLRVGLVMECEWGNDEEVLQDFRKLLLARADERLIVFEGKTDKSNAELIERMRGEIGRFSGTEPRDRYLFASWPKRPKKDVVGFRFDLHVV